MSDRVRLLFVAPWFLFPRIVRRADPDDGRAARHEGRGVRDHASPRRRRSTASTGAPSWRRSAIASSPGGTIRSAPRSTASARPRLAPAGVRRARSFAQRARRASRASSRARRTSSCSTSSTRRSWRRTGRCRCVRSSSRTTSRARSTSATRRWRAARCMRAVWRRQRAKMERFEREALSRFDTVVAVSERDAEFFRERARYRRRPRDPDRRRRGLLCVRAAKPGAAT